IIRRIPKNTSARTAITDLVNSWRLPSQVSAPNELEPGTWLIAEVDGSLALNLGAQFGYDYNWIRQAQLGGLSGDIGLRLQLAVAATFGFQASGKFAVVLSRESADERVRLRLFKQRVKGWNFAFNAGA